MKRLRDLSISWKLTLLAVVTSLLVLLGTAIAFSVIDHHTTHAEMVEHYSKTANVFGSNCLKALDFKDASEASVVLSWLHLDPEVSLAIVYDLENKEFASFEREAIDTPPLESLRHLNGKFGSDGYFHLVRAVKDDPTDDGEVVGHIYLRVGCEKLWVRLWSQIRLSVFILLISVLVSIAVASRLQRAISQPILKLAETAYRVIESGDYSLRVQKDSEDELGKLVSAFNQMLTTIGIHNAELE